MNTCADLIITPFCAIFNQSVTSGIIPDEWELSKVALCSNRENGQI